MIKKVKEILEKADIRDVGFCRFEELSRHLIECRAKLRIPKNAKTVIVFIFPYKVEDNPPENISRYAAVPDYHKVCGRVLEDICNQLKKHIDNYQFEWFIDNSPLPEVYTAAKAGLGVIGKNDLLINKKYGSFVFIGEIVTDLELSVKDIPVEYCSNCGVCTSVCPKCENGGECLSKLSQKKGELTESEKSLLQKYGIVWGCDICADNCPLNKTAESTYIEEFKKGYRNRYTLGEDISGRAYEWRGEKTVKRNALLGGERKSEQ